MGLSQKSGYLLRGPKRTTAKFESRMGSSPTYGNYHVCIYIYRQEGHHRVSCVEFGLSLDSCRV